MHMDNWADNAELIGLWLLTLAAFGVAVAFTPERAGLRNRIMRWTISFVLAAGVHGFVGMSLPFSLLQSGNNWIMIPGSAGVLTFFAAATLLRLVNQTLQKDQVRQFGSRPLKTRLPPEPAPTPIPPDVFISYRRDERPEVLDIARRLEALKVKVWFDADLRSGTSFDTEIDRQVRSAKCVLVCWSPGATASDWVRGEATIGRQRGVLAAVMLKPCDLPSPFNLVHAEDLSGGIEQQPLEWRRLLERIGPLVGRPGLAEYVRLESAPEQTELALWMARNPGDPLFDLAAARLKAAPA